VLRTERNDALDPVRIVYSDGTETTLTYAGAARPSVDVAIINGGGIRADLPEGALTNGTLYEAFPPPPAPRRPPPRTAPATDRAAPRTRSDPW